MHIYVQVYSYEVEMWIHVQEVNSAPNEGTPIRMYIYGGCEVILSRGLVGSLVTHISLRDLATPNLAKASIHPLTSLLFLSLTQTIQKTDNWCKRLQSLYIQSKLNQPSWLYQLDLTDLYISEWYIHTCSLKNTLIEQDSHWYPLKFKTLKSN